MGDMPCLSVFKVLAESWWQQLELPPGEKRFASLLAYISKSLAGTPIRVGVCDFS